MLRNTTSHGRHFRRRTASTFVLIMLTICFILLPLLMVMSQLSLYTVDRSRIQNVVEAAGLLAANDMSRIVINDRNFGYVSLSNYPPVGKATRALDGEPLPVTGINTLVGTVRQNEIVAHELGNETMISLADADRSSLDSTIRELNSALSNSLSAKQKGDLFDIQGENVDAVKDVKAFLTANLPKSVRLASLKLSNGWLAEGGQTTIPIPQPERLAQLKPIDFQRGTYKSFVDLPVADRSFTFAGLGSTSTIVTPSLFRNADGKHICSIIKVECSLALNDVHQPFGTGPVSNLQCAACCQPYSMPEVGPSGVMTVRFSGGPVSGLQSWSDLLNASTFHDHQVNAYDVIGGDYPLDRSARMQRAVADSNTSQLFAEHLYYWLRSAHLRPRLDAVLQMIDEPFRSTPHEIYAYEPSNDGTISRRIIALDPFAIGVTSDAQSSTVVDTRLHGGFAPIIIFRNNVKNLGSQDGGKHAGQAPAGNPLNWCELQEYGGDDWVAQRLGKGRLGTKLALNDSSNAPLTSGLQNASYSPFRTAEGKTLDLQPRKNFYSGGLAVDIEIGGTGPSTASLDVSRMRKLKR